MELTFEEFSSKNRERMRQWHEGDTLPWTGADWSNAMCGEAGETANVVKKLRRIETNIAGSQDPERDVLISQLADELHDVVAYADLLADHYGIDFAAAQVDKFNRVSRREGFSQLLGER